MASLSFSNAQWNYTWEGDNLIAMENGTWKLVFYYDATGEIAGLRSFTSPTDSYRYSYYKNLQGDIMGLYDESGNVVIRYEYDSWGNVLSVKDGDGNEITSPNSIGIKNPFRYRGYYYDAESGLYYVSSRYYDPGNGRFVNADDADVLLASPNALTDKNLYAYCDNNPIVRVDHGGECWVTCIVVGAVIGALIGGISSIVGQAISGQKINWAEVGVSAASGALTGAITAACPGMSAVVTGLMHGAVGSASYAAAELVNGRTPSVAGTFAAGITSGVLAGGTKAIGNVASRGKIEIGNIKGVRASGAPGVRYKSSSGTVKSIEIHSAHHGFGVHLQSNTWWYNKSGYVGKPYRAYANWRVEIFKPSTWRK